MTRSNFLVEKNHPSLPGHFPGNPIVPGVVILQYVFATFGKLYQHQIIKEILNVKFKQLLSIDEESEITFKEIHVQKFQFLVKQNDQLIASGSLITENSP